jgi:rubredoxin
MKTVKEGSVNNRLPWYFLAEFACQNCGGIYTPEESSEVAVTPNTSKGVGQPLEYATIQCPNCGSTIQNESPQKVQKPTVRRGGIWING